MAWIAVDAGTSVIKAVAFDGEGRELALAREKTDVLRPRAGFAEQSMESVWEAVVSTVRDVTAELTEAVEGIAITAQGDGCWLVDSGGQPAGNAILWNDGRATEIVERWHEEGTIVEAFKSSGSVAYPGLCNAILQWLAEHEPARLHEARHVLSCNGWIFAQMTGRFVADLSDASNPFGDVTAREYSSYLLQLYGLGEQREKLPEIARREAVVGRLSAKAASELGVSVDTAVVMAPYDIVTTAYGAGASEAGQACVILGTTICAEIFTASLALDCTPAGTTIATEDGLHLRAMPTLTGCETLEWMVQCLGLKEIADLEALAAVAAEGSSGVLFLPYLSPAGERAPFLEPRAKGSFHNLTLLHTRADLARSIFEGLTFAIRECLETAAKDIAEVRVCGGGARSDLWCQMIADVTGVTVLRPIGREVGARGAFLFAQKTVGNAASLSEAAREFPVGLDVFEARVEARRVLDERYNAFIAVREHVRSQWAIAKVRA